MFPAVQHRVHGLSQRVVPFRLTSRSRQDAATPTQLEQRLLTHLKQARSLTKRRRFHDARVQYERAMHEVFSQAAHPARPLSVPLLARLFSHYGSLLIRLEDFPLAARALSQAREYYHRLKTKALLKGSRQAHQYFRAGQEVVGLEGAYLMLRQREYLQARTQVARFLKDLRKGGRRAVDGQMRWLRANARLVIAWTYYEQRQYREADQHVKQIEDMDPAFAEIEPLRSLLRARQLLTAGKSEEALAGGLADCRAHLTRVNIEWPEAGAECA